MTPRRVNEMNEHEPDIDARDISALYRGVGRDEPPPALDDAILRAARVDARGTRARRWLPGAAGLSAAAGIMVAVFTALLFGGLDEHARFTLNEAVGDSMREESPSRIQPVPVTGGTGGQATGLAPGPLVEPLPLRGDEALRRNVVNFRIPSSEVGEDGTERQREALAPPLQTQALNGDRVEDGIRAAPRARAAGSLPPSSARGAQTLQDLLQLVEEARLTETQEQRLVEPPAAITAGPAAEDWLAEIQALLDEGRRAEAEARLEAFRGAYPEVDYEAVLRFPASPGD